MDSVIFRQTDLTSHFLTELMSVSTITSLHLGNSSYSRTWLHFDDGILPLLWVLLGGTGTVIGPFIGTLFMFYLIDLASGFTTAHLLIAGVALVVLTLFAPQGLAGELRRRVWRWLP